MTTDYYQEPVKCKNCGSINTYLWDEDEISIEHKCDDCGYVTIVFDIDPDDGRDDDLIF